MANNPVLVKLEKQPPPAPSTDDLQRMYNQPTVAPPTYPGAPGNIPPQTPGYGTPSAFAPQSGSRYMTLDDVVVRTGAMLGVILISGAFSWAMGTSQYAGAMIFVGLLGGLGLGLYISFSLKANAVTSLLYAAFEGLFLGAISRAFESAYPGIVIQAITGTLMVAVGMLFVYKIGAIRVTPRFTRIVSGALIGILGLMLVNIIASFFHAGGLGLRDGGALSIVFSLVCIVVASMSLVMDFDMIERAITRGTDEKFAWYCSFGLMVTLIWMYLEILRLLASLRD